MKNNIKFTLIISFAIAWVFGISLFPNFVSGENKVLATKRIYQQNCARCHGSDGKGNNELGRSLETPDLTQSRPSVSKTSSIVKYGEGQMPAFKKKLSAKEIASVSNYVRTLR